MSPFMQLVLAPLFPMMREELGVSYAVLGSVLMVFFTVSALLQPVAGFVVDRFGGRGVLLGGLGLMVIGALMTSFAHGPALLFAGAVVSGTGNSVFHPADFSILNGTVTQKRLGYAFSTHGVAGMLGYAAAPLFSAAIGTAYGWHNALLAAAALVFIVLVLLGANAKLFVGQGETKKRDAGPVDARVLLAVPVLMCFAFFTLHAAGLGALQQFGVSAMKEYFNVGTGLASSALTAYILGSAAGMVAGGVVSPRAPPPRPGAALWVAAGARNARGLAIGAGPGAAPPPRLAPWRPSMRWSSPWAWYPGSRCPSCSPCRDLRSASLIRRAISSCARLRRRVRPDASSDSCTRGLTSARSPRPCFAAG